MKNKIIIIGIIILFCICILSGAILLLNNNEEDFSNNNIERENELITEINVTIDGKVYKANIEENETAQSFVNMLPAEFNMNELNGNEKYIYLDYTFKTNSYNPKHIEAGDIMLYGNDCLVVFYKSFDTTFDYTKIGHIDNLIDLGNKSISIKFEK